MVVAVPQSARLCCTKQRLRDRNIHIKRYTDVAIADMEVVFPEKNTHLKSSTMLEIVVTLIGGLVAAVGGFWGVSLWAPICCLRCGRMCMLPHATLMLLASHCLLRV
jgi:Protein of unknown function (DUF3754)